ncbi:cell wall-binding repeat-containing protein [Microbacterium sp. LWH7-1.2]|uniref:cell wall-binding repeat-containing protein n=1 Tax=Microbacterium sp. LWH7-1.2 TaxID=3135257 RepID=UPI003139A32B
MKRVLAVGSVVITAVLGATVLAAAPAVAVDGATIHGRLLNPGGGLLTGEETYSVALQLANSTQRYATFAKSDGTYSIEGVEPGEYWVRFGYSGPHGYLDKYLGDVYYLDTALHPGLTLSAGDTVEASEQLDPPSWVKGRVTGVSGAIDSPSVTITGRTPGWAANHVPAPEVDADGTFTVGPIAPGDYDMSFSSDTSRWVGENQNGAPLTAGATGAPVVVGVGTTSTLNPVLDAAGRVEATVGVKEGDGKITPYTGNVTWWTRYPFGNFAFPGAPTSPGVYDRWTQPGSSYNLLVPEDRANFIVGRWWDGAPDVTASQPLSAEPNSIRTISATAVRGGTITGRVGVAAFIGGAPAFGGNDIGVYVYRHTLQGGLEPISAIDAGGSAFPLGSSMWNAGTGTFTTPVLEPGTYTLFFAPTDESVGGEYYEDARYFAERTDVVVRAGEARALGDLSLEPRYFDVGRIAGEDRFDTAVQISRALFDDGERPEVVYIANGRNFPDALSAGPAAITRGGVILTTEQGQLPSAVAKELARLRPERIVVAGGPVAVSDAVLEQLKAYVDSPSGVSRLSGETRYETAAAIVRDAFPDQTPVAFLATGTNYPDALAAGAAAGYSGSPVVLIDGAALQVSTETFELLRDLGVGRVYLVGGPSAISDAIQQSLARGLSGVQVLRLAGDNRFATAAVVNARIFPAAETALLTNGYGFADALTGAPLAGAAAAPMFLSQQGCLPVETAQGVWDLDARGIFLVGGPAVLSPAVEALAVCG